MSNWVKPYIKQNKGRMTLTIFLGLLGVSSGAMLLFISGYLISKSALRPENVMAVYVPIVATRAFSIGQAVFHYIERLVGHDVVLRILEKMRTKLYRIVEPQALFFRSRFQTGDMLGVLSEDIEHLQNLYLRTIFPSILALVVYSIFVLVIGAFDLVFALIVGCMLAIIVFLLPFVSLLLTKKHHVTLKQGRSRLYQQLTDAVFGLSDWQASGRKGEFINEYVKQNDQLLKIEKRVKRWYHIRDSIIQSVVGIVVISMIIWTGNEAASEQIAPTVIAAFVLMTLSVTNALIPIADAIDRIPSYVESTHRLNGVESDIVLHDKMDLYGDNDYVEPRHVDIELNHVSYSYPDSNEIVLKDVSLQIKAGKKIAILGRSGTGKSTLLKLLTGALSPVNGQVVLNGERAHTNLLSKYISVLNQKPHLFDTTIGNNVRIGKPEATDEEIWKALEKVQLASHITSLPDGLQTKMHEMGKRFSGGERQRVAFARTLMQETPIIVLDEPTIGLDPKTELSLIETMFSATEEKTVIWITHHLVGIEHVDEVIFLDRGQIVMQGSHKQLLKENEKYRKLYELDKGI
ncbi:thiol reductant ABC exporter subunit CydC [Bacillus thuringiensis]|uniref:ABC transporter, CydDC cysteine exporter (CydDC-E) family, permease/ATP-binding protein CydC n=1 Tax=Bacillus cereus (strain G9842) TaxID=405531 RepID=B7ISE9_BACC2|nr:MULTISPECIES: thiol reductant ABC exporter subunit CydC [Bacillus cereus group]ACK93455.1 ABC transporter, CydDC cysteine exporter (CydDC-E) family, permease/ATP-binding protein CydC [Bacillus cereus G9842]MDR4135315.1 thiol reductant ABC exporter subunit CydC [Bacillus cereus]MDR4367499.1 thiol reductant ABC exporter subunit CydC [Bacillus cereus]PER88372.1 thiol reductant ABC exporter subunit CydC [Bacillus thuringiensis]PGS45345.1 thiol reductant ABC exporter subunit CydC [Bacillus thuri